MSARDARDTLLKVVHTWLIECTTWPEGEAPAEARKMLDAYDHEQAERIRAHCASTMEPCGCPGADLIDPMKEGDRG